MTAVTALSALSCSPFLQPTTVPATPNPEIEPFRAALQAYVDQTQPYRKQAAQAGNRVPGQTGSAPNAATGVRTRQNVLAEALSTARYSGSRATAGRATGRRKPSRKRC